MAGGPRRRTGLRAATCRLPQYRGSGSRNQLTAKLAAVPFAARQVRVERDCGGHSEPKEPPFAAVVLLGMERGLMRRKFGNRNDWWDWYVILLIVAGGTIVLWTGVWVAHSRAEGPGMHTHAAISR